MSSGYVYIIRNSLVPNGFKVGMSKMPVISASGKFIGRIQSYGSTFPFGEWEVLHLQKCRNAKGKESQLVEFFRNKGYDSPGKSNEWFIGNWEEVYKGKVLDRKNITLQIGSFAREVKKRNIKEKIESDKRLEEFKKEQRILMAEELLKPKKVVHTPYYEEKRNPSWFKGNQYSSYGRYR
jgi:hypothetical protein